MVHARTHVRTCSHVAHFLLLGSLTICAVVKSKCAVEKDNGCTKKCKDSGKNGDLCADYLVLCSCKSCFKEVLIPVYLHISTNKNATIANLVLGIDLPNVGLYVIVSTVMINRRKLVFDSFF